jgi:hypothetical protein
MDELLNEDQRMILFMIEENAKLQKPKQIVLIHNYKRQMCDDDDVDDFIDSQIKNTFGAKLDVHDDAIAKKNYPNIHRKGLWTSHWEIESKSSTRVEIPVTHAVLFENVGDCKPVNNDMFNYLHTKFVTGKQDGNIVRKESFLQILASSFGSRIGQFLTFSDPPGTPSPNKPKLSRQMMSSCNRFIVSDYKGKVAKLHPWELRDLPPGDFDGEFKPNSEVVLDGNDDKYYVVILDLPGMSYSDRIGATDAHPVNDTKNWFRFKYKNADSSDIYNYKLIEGRLNKQFPNQRSNQFGKFMVSFPIPTKYSGNFLKLENGRLIMASCRKLEDEDGNPIPCVPPAFMETA